MDAVTDLPTTCPRCTDPSQPCQRFLFDRGTPDAHVVWECDHCGDTGVLQVPAEFGFTIGDAHSYNIS